MPNYTEIGQGIFIKNERIDFMANKYDYKAVLIGNYAYYRFMFMQRCMPDIFYESLEKEEFWEHLTDVQKTMDAYRDNYRNIVTHSEEYCMWSAVAHI